jgi:hypothetical protein
MRNFELIAILNKMPAGAKVVFCSTLDKNRVTKCEDGFYVETEINDVDGNENEITLLC